MFKNLLNMKWDTVPAEKVYIDGALLKLGMVIQIGSYINREENKDVAQLSVGVVKMSSVSYLDSKRLYVHLFKPVALDDIRGDVIVPAAELLRWDRGHLDYREVSLSAIILSEIQEVKFDFAKRNGVCHLWFGCIKERLTAIVPMADWDKYFDPLPR
jgi:hypothetical protein